METHQSSPKLNTAREVAEVVGVHHHTVLKWARDGQVPCRKIGRKTIRFVLGDVVRAMKNFKPNQA